MHWYDFLAYFFGGAFLANALPHLINGVSGRSFQSPFAKPPGKGLSSPVVNDALGIFQSRRSLLRSSCKSAPSASTISAMSLQQEREFFVMSLMSALTFGRFHSGR